MHINPLDKDVKARRMDHRSILGQLTDSPPQPLSVLGNTYGIYALWDHEGQIRYIGCTPKATEGFRVRVTNKHVTGSEGRSHKFSQAYCIGRMWRYCKKLHPEVAPLHQRESDAKLAKRLRTAFIRRYCKVTCVQIPEAETVSGYFGFLTGLESRIQQSAPSEMRAWEGIRFPPIEEPVELVDRLLDSMPEVRNAVERQGFLYRKYVLEQAGNGRLRSLLKVQDN